MHRVPVGKTIAYAYGFTFGHLGTIIGLAWLPLVISAVLQFLPYAFGVDSGTTPENATAQGRQALEGMATGLLIILLNAMIFVPVVRQALGLRQGTAIVHFKLGVPEFRLFAAILLLLLVTFVLALGLRLLEVGVGLLASGRGAIAGILAVLSVLAASLGFVYAIVRLGFLVLSVTVAEEQISLVRGWVLTKGNFWRIFGIVLAIGVPLAIAYSLVVIGIIGPLRLFARLPADPTAAAQAFNARFAILQQHMPLYIGLNLIIAPFAIGLNAAASAFGYRALVSPEPAESREIPAR
ncbi:MAG TPA: hypothetical protein VL286_09125 [Rhizomicrobium sp.]|jgi:hypothetical protein|nr:hypothetical protein [Rhizomicrobium sp.]